MGDCLSIMTMQGHTLYSSSRKFWLFKKKKNFPSSVTFTHLALCDFFLLPWEKINVRGRRFDTVWGPSSGITCDTKQAQEEAIPGSFQCMKKLLEAVYTFPIDYLETGSDRIAVWWNFTWCISGTFEFHLVYHCHSIDWYLWFFIFIYSSMMKSIPDMSKEMVINIKGKPGKVKW